MSMKFDTEKNLVFLKNDSLYASKCLHANATVDVTSFCNPHTILECQNIQTCCKNCQNCIVYMNDTTDNVQISLQTTTHICLGDELKCINTHTDVTNTRICTCHVCQNTPCPHLTSTREKLLKRGTSFNNPIYICGE